MNTFFIAMASFVGFIAAYHTYGRWLARRIFVLDPSAIVPSRELEDGHDFVPSKKSIVFGHHFTSIAGTGPIVGPAIAVFWGWLPALLWVVLGSIFIGAVHDFGALVVSLRNQGQTIGEIAGRMISSRTRLLFLFALFFALTVVLAIFGLVIAQIFQLYPESVLGVWISLPIAVLIGLRLRAGSKNLIGMSLISLTIIYASIYLGAYYLPIVLPVENPVIVWTFILLAYCAVASVLPVWLLLQPRDYVNSHLLYVALGLLVAGISVASLTGQADLLASAPAVTAELPAHAPPIWPFLFITIACGAVSGFHCLVSSGTSSKQIACEPDALAIGYGSMLLEGALAVMVILACCAGVGMGKFEPIPSSTGQFGHTTEYRPVLDSEGQPLIGRAAWRATYNVGSNHSWQDFKMGDQIGAFVDGSANFLTTIGIPLQFGIGIMAVLVACFAATTLDSATRLQRYVIQELAGSIGLKPLTNAYSATALAVILGGAIAMLPGKPGAAAGTGGLLLWPLFGATNQLLAGMAFLVTAFYLWRRNKPIWFLVFPTAFMIFLPAWALLWQLFNSETGWIGGWQNSQWVWRWKNNQLLGTIGLLTVGLQAWMILESLLAWRHAKGVLETALKREPAPKI